MALLLLVGGFVGAAQARRGPTANSWSGSDLRCSAETDRAEGSATVLSELSVDNSRAPIDLTYTVTVTVPTSWWEVAALTAPDVRTSRRMDASACLIGEPFFYRDLEPQLSPESAAFVYRSRQLYLGRSRGRSCLGVFDTHLEQGHLHALLNDFANCFWTYTGTSAIPANGHDTVRTAPETEFVARLETPQLRDAELSPVPTRATTGSYEWSWTGRDAPADLRVEVPLSADAYISTWLRNGGGLLRCRPTTPPW